ncbi:hypothetical protein DESC_780098 [Desulfosarcina cetonica]|nr:hypothetical protein DESC_780098 [Desulfosarcina cetonica]
MIAQVMKKCSGIQVYDGAEQVIDKQVPVATIKNHVRVGCGKQMTWRLAKPGLPGRLAKFSQGSGVNGNRCVKGFRNPHSR